MDQLECGRWEATQSFTDPCAAFRRASRAITQLYDLVLAPTGLKATQFIILQAIGARGEIAQCRLAHEHSMAVETLSRRLASLRSAGLVAQRIGNTRHRERLYRLTEMGQEKVQAAAPYWERATDRLQLAIGSGEWDSVLAAAGRAALAARQAEHLKLSALPPSTARAACAAASGTNASRESIIT